MPRLKLPLDFAGRPVLKVYLYVGGALASVQDILGIANPVPVELAAILDTGAGTTVVEREWITRLGLSPVGERVIHKASTGASPVISHVYRVAIELSEDVAGRLAANLEVVATEDLKGFGVQMLLGRDVLDGKILFYDGKRREIRLRF